ncbi:S24 family peptidase [Brevundimonas sp. FT23028]|uniref:S24 family peptidase n=1 Tax=Brevundimonas sp. FT23028 TaxID=3393748 RepID=UPI003B58670F
MASLKTVVEKRLAQIGKNPFEAARDGGLERNFVNDIINGKKQSVRGDNLAKLAKGLNATSAEVLSGQFGDGGEQTTPDVDLNVEAGTMVAIPEYDVRLSAGGGSLVDQEKIIDYWQFSRRYLESELRVSPSSLGVVTVDGDSMYPTLWSGDRVMVDLSETNPAKPGVYAIFDSDATVVKRIEKVPASDPVEVVLISDNKNHNQYRVPAELVTVIGRVVWFARRI